MTYGMEVKNSSDRVIFTTEEGQCLYTYSGVTTSPTNGLELTAYKQSDFLAGKLLFARPQDGETGAICGNLNTSNYTFFGGGEYGNENTLGGWTHEDDFPSAPGVKYAIASRFDAATPGTGYGLQAFKSNGDLIIDTTGITKRISILDIVTGGSTGKVTYTAPSSINFDHVYVVASQFQANMTWSASAEFVPGSSYVYGTWAYFKDSTSQIKFYNGWIADYGNQIYYDASSTTSTFNGIGNIQYIILYLPLG
jgi:hypothetical protein